MRILYARNLFRPVDFGGNRYPFEVTTRLARRGHDVVVVTGRFAETIDTPGVRLVKYPVSRRHPVLTFSTNALFSRIAVARVVATWHPDVIVLGSYDVAYGCRTLSFARARSVFTYHSSFHSEAVRRLASGPPPARFAYGPARTFLAHVERVVLTSTDRIVAVSPFSANEIEARLGHDSGRTVVIPTGVDVKRFSPGDRDSARSKLGLAKDALVLITVGRLTPVKRYDRAIRAVARLREEGFQVTLLVVGDGPEREALFLLARELGVSRHVRFEGFRDCPDLVDRLRAADLQLCTSEFENWSLALLEGLASGLPVLGTPYGGTSQMLAPVDALLVLPDGGVESFVRRIVDLTANRTRLDELRRRARSYAEGFAWESVIRRLEELLSSLTLGH